MRINTNISALNTNNSLNKANSKMEKALERLSSGYRINKAADDAAGLAISTKMKTQIAALDQANRNSADAVSVIQTAEGALNEVHSMLQRMRELSVQSANDTMNAEDRATIQEEVEQLKKEIDRISDTTEFNTKSLLDGSVDNKVLSSNKAVDVLYISDEVDPKEYTVTVKKAAAKATLSATGPILAGNCPGGTLKINGESLTIEAGASEGVALEKVKSFCSTMGIEVTTAGGANATLQAGASIVLTNERYGASYGIDLTDSDASMLSYLGLPGPSVTKGVDAEITKDSGFGKTATVLSDGNTVTITDQGGFMMKIDVAEVTAKSQFNLTVLDAGPMNIQVGAYEHQTMAVRIPKTDTESLGIDTVNIKNRKGAENAIVQIDSAITQVSAVRAKLGAYQNRLEHTINNLEEASLNTTEAISRLNDTDMAAEMTEYTQQSVLVQAATSMLAQANEKPQQVLSLLQG